MCQSEEDCAFSLKNQWKQENAISPCDCWRADFKVMGEGILRCCEPRRGSQIFISQNTITGQPGFADIRNFKGTLNCRNGQVLNSWFFPLCGRMGAWIQLPTPSTSIRLCTTYRRKELQMKFILRWTKFNRNPRMHSSLCFSSNYSLHAKYMYRPIKPCVRDSKNPRPSFNLKKVRKSTLHGTS